jgi:hypothetical protein
MRTRGTGLEAGLNSLARKLNRQGGQALKQVAVHEAWTTIAGPSVLNHTTGAHLRGRELVVYVDSALWATELTALSEKYREALNQELGENAVTSVRFTVSRRVEESARIARAEAYTEQPSSNPDPPSVPLTPEERAQVEASTAVIPDKELREAVTRATIADLEWKKGIKAAKSSETRREGP